MGNEEQSWMKLKQSMQWEFPQDSILGSPASCSLYERSTGHCAGLLDIDVHSDPALLSEVIEKDLNTPLLRGSN